MSGPDIARIMQGGLLGWLEALACDCESTDGWEEAAVDIRQAAATITTLQAEVVKKDAKIADLSNALAMSKAYVRKLQHRAALERAKP